MPDFNPTPIKNVKVNRIKLRPCKNNMPLLTTIASTDRVQDPYFIQIKSKNFKSYGVTSVECCYHEVKRKKGSDSETELSSKCFPFKDNQALDKAVETIFVKCLSGSKEVYRNVHTIVAQKEKFQTRQKASKMKKTSKILMVGFDSMSRMNFERGMPKMFGALKDKTEWFHITGYTRIANSSFPNLFAILTGRSFDEKSAGCDPTSKTFLDDCGFIWKDFEKAGYVTGEVEYSSLKS